MDRRAGASGRNRHPYGECFSNTLQVELDVARDLVICLLADFPIFVSELADLALSPPYRA
jgi:hypothetical protein